MDLSVVITSHQNSQGLYLTTFAAIQQLSNSGLSWEIILVCDGGTEWKYEKLPNVRVIRGRFGSPQGSRNAGILAASAERILVLEDHVVISNAKSLIFNLIALGAAMVFPVRFYEGTELFNVYGTETDWDGNFWYKKTLYSPILDKPYRVPQFGHSCFAIDKKCYLDVGGYTNLLTGYGAEEQFLCLKFWMLGYQIWQVPSVWHAHYLSDHGMGGAMFSEQYKKNFQIVKYVLTGDKQNLQITSEMKAERNRIEQGPFKGDINKLKQYLREQGVI